MPLSYVTAGVEGAYSPLHTHLLLVSGIADPPPPLTPPPPPPCYQLALLW